MEVRMYTKVLDHDEASRLLPWLGTDRLAAGELEPLLDHLKICRLCRSELRDLSDLGRAAELAERGEAPDAAAIDRRLARLVGRLDGPPPCRPAPRSPFTARPAGAFGWQQILPLAALVVLAVGLFFFTPGRPRPGAAVYSTLSSPEKPGPAGPHPAGPHSAGPHPAGPHPAGAALRVVIADSCTQGELRRLLGAAGAEIRSGPTKLGVYTIFLPEGALPEIQIAAWRPLACFSFVDRAAGDRTAGEAADADRARS